MNNLYTIKNFRVFDEKGATLSIKPITILTGCNSSGKSSIVKSMVLLDTYIKGLRERFKAFNDLNLLTQKLDFTKESTSSLGNFKRVIHKGSDSNEIMFEYEVHSLLLGEEVKVELCFSTNEKDALNDGFLKKITIKNHDNELLYTSSAEHPCVANYNLIKDNFFKFIKGQTLYYWYQKYEEDNQMIFDDPTFSEYQDDTKKKIEELMEDFFSSYGKESIVDIIRWCELNGYSSAELIGSGKKILLDRYGNGNLDIVNVSKDKGTIFYIPILENFFDCTNEVFSIQIRELAKGLNLSKELLLAIDKIAQDFGASDCTTFGDYYRQKETEFFNYDISKEKFSSYAYKIAPFINTSHYFLDIYSNIEEGYLNKTVRLHGKPFLDDMCIQMYTPEEKKEFENWPLGFRELYDVLMNLNSLKNGIDSPFFTKREDKVGPYDLFDHHLLGMFKGFIKMVFEDILTTEIPSNISYVPTSLVSIKRLYSLDSNDTFTNLLKKYFEAKRTCPDSFSLFRPGDFINEWISKFGIGERLSIEVNEDGLGVSLRLYQDKDDQEGRLLAELGYGITQLITILIRIETAILESNALPYSEDEYSLSSHKSIVFEICSDSTIAIEEPEVHLHPNYQSLLADMFYDAFIKYNINFIIETHSEYLIRRSQVIVAERKYESNAEVEKECPFQTYYVPNGGLPYSLGYRKDGKFQEKFGSGFYDEASNLAFEIL